MRNIIFAIAITSILFLGNACSSADGNNPGTEYMPDMYHSIAYEANLDDYYYYNTWGTKGEYSKIAGPRKPVNGTIPRGYAGAGAAKHMNGTASTSAMVIPVNGSVPYYYADTEEERTRAMTEIINNPYPITDAGLERAKPLYDINCGICHGAKGDGAGYLYDSDTNPNAKYPAAPANFLSDEFKAASNGRYYHAIMHGKNVMGGYADKLSYEERWQVIHYIHALQAKDSKLAYSESENTFNTVDMPKASAQYIAHSASHAVNMGNDAHHGDMEGHAEMHQTGGAAHGHDGNAGHGHGHGQAHEHDGATETHSHEGQEVDADGKKKDGIIKKIIKKVDGKVSDIKEKKAAKKAAKDKGH